MNHKSYLDLSNCKNNAIKEWFSMQLIIPVEKSRYEFDLDILESECNPVFIFNKKWRCARKHRIKKRTLSKYQKHILKINSFELWSKPIGFSFRKIPAGAVIKHYQD